MMLVSAIMPTRARPELAAKALECFLAQTYENKELIILDDEDAPSFKEPCVGANVAYFRTAHRWNIAQKRNALVRLSCGELIMHLDDDDHVEPTRMAEQVQLLEESGKQVTGYHSILFYEEGTGIYGRHVMDSFAAFGTSLMYYKSWWAAHPFDEAKTIGEDNGFVHAANCERQLITANGISKIVARMHPGNTSAKDMGNCRPAHESLIPAGFIP